MVWEVVIDYLKKMTKLKICFTVPNCVNAVIDHKFLNLSYLSCINYKSVVHHSPVSTTPGNYFGQKKYDLVLTNSRILEADF